MHPSLTAPLPVLLAVGLLLSGCAGKAEVQNEPTPPPAGADAPAAWSASTRSGEFVAVPTESLQRFGTRGRFQIPESASAVWLNLTVEGPLAYDLRIRYTPPDCYQSACSVEANTTTGMANITLEHPKAGEWGFRFLAKDTYYDASHGTYRLDIRSQIRSEKETG